ncbi:hypothetical protein [Acidiferrobacter sp.]|uniref:hypothetical protein n=1 Tax=Acidiferrobacter sp. TaxID=1872107 RepID=UPI00263196F0|nr:hypothetical protein [Acidiferrobacter sp.]
MTLMKRVAGMIMTILLSGCASTALHASAPPHLAPGAAISVAPFANYTTTPGAGARAASMTASLLTTHGLGAVTTLAAERHNRLPLGLAPNPAALLRQARAMGARYMVDGAVQEWRYTIGLDGQPAVAVTMNLVSVRTGQILWSATGSRSGTPRESVGVLAENTLNAMVQRLLS